MITTPINGSVATFITYNLSDCFFLIFLISNQSRLIFPKIQIIFLFFFFLNLILENYTILCIISIIECTSLCIEIQSHSINVYLVVCKFWFRTIRRVGQYFIREINTFYIRKWRKFFRCIFVLWTVYPKYIWFESTRSFLRYIQTYIFFFLFFTVIIIYLKKKTENYLFYKKSIISYNINLRFFFIIQYENKKLLIIKINVRYTTACRHERWHFFENIRKKFRTM